MKRKILLFIFPMILISAVFPTIPVFAEKTDVTYEENFEYGDTDISPVAKCGSVQIVPDNDGNHFLRFKGNDTNYSLTPFGPYIADYDFSVRFRQNTYGGQKRWSKILIHSEWGESKTYQINLYNYRVTATYTDDASHIQETISEKNGIEIADNVWHDIRIYSRGDKCTVCLNGKKILSFSSNRNPEGCFGFVTWQTDFEVDDISITEYSDGEAPDVGNYIAPDEENKQRAIIETERKTRTMKNEAFTVSQVVSGTTYIHRLITVISFTVAAAAVIVLVVVIIYGYKKERKK